MPKLDLNVDLIKVTLRIRKDDHDFIAEMAATTRGDVSYNSIIREIIHNYVLRLKDQERTIRDNKTEELEAKAEISDLEIAL